MTRDLIMLIAAFSLFAIGSSAFAAGLSCPYNDKMHPEKSRVCRDGMLYVCEDGQWKRLGVRCSSR